MLSEQYKLKVRDSVLSVLNSYSQVFFSDNWVFGILLMLTTFLFPLAGLAGLVGVIFANTLAYGLGFDLRKNIKGLWGYNVLLSTLPLGLFFEPGPAFWIMVLVISLLTLILTVVIQGILSKYQLPFLSVPFVLVIWIIILATREFEALQINPHNTYQLNQLYGIGGTRLVVLYEWFQEVPIGSLLRSYLTSLSAIFFQNSLAGGILIASGLLIASRISFVLSVIGFLAAFSFYHIMGLSISETDYSNIGFNFMLTAIAIGGFYHIPGKMSFIWVILLTPIVALFTVGFSSILGIWQLSIYALPFNITTILFIYFLKWRFNKGKGLQEVLIQRNSPERNLYSFINYSKRFRNHRHFNISLPFWGDWTVSQGHNGSITHRDEWRHAWDFVLTGADRKTYRGYGANLSDFLAFDKPVLSPVNGYVVEVVDTVQDNPIGEVNLNSNWGNTVIIKIDEHFYAKLSHFKKDSIQVRKGDWVETGRLLGNCGNSGRSPEPHIHFQLQSTPYIDSKTLEYPIAHYLARSGQGSVSHSFDYPKENQIVSNPEPVVLLQNLLSFVPGQILKIKFIRNNLIDELHWEVKATAFNEPYLECLKSGDKAFYQNDGTLFSFVHFEGKRKSPLYYFYLAFFQLPLYYGHNTSIQDEFPPDKIFSGITLVFQDFLAPFALYLKGEFEIDLPEKESIFGTNEIQILSRAKLCIFEHQTQAWEFKANFSDQRMELFGKNNQEDFHLIWEKN